ncbi:MAG: long-chain fatty acid--CoA ligase [Deltaproteobacteria bacterium]|nr:long-chain fatty acid--CoA ligase [Deltaproteobacteria bacterium]
MTDYDETSMAAVFLNQVEKYGERACVAFKEDGQYTDISWNRMGDMVRNLAAFLISMGIRKGDIVAIFSPNRYEWWVSDLAVLSIGAADVPVYATNSAEEAFYMLDHSGARACFVGGQEHLEKILQAKGRLPNLEFIVVYDSVKHSSDNVVTFADALEKGRVEDTRDEFNNRIGSIKPSDLATIIYTSGTTGLNKGVMLSHNNLISNIRQILEIREILKDEELFLSFLPLSHVLERTVGYYLPVSIGAKVAFAEDFSKLQQNLTEVRPTVIISVPRLYEKVRAGILSKVNEAAPFKKALFNWAVRLASENLPYVCSKRQRKGLFALKYHFADRLIFSKLKKTLGMDRLRLTVSGGGPLSVSDAEFFLGMEIIVLEGFGLTETTPVTHVNRPWLIKPGTVGPPVKDTTVKLSEEGEILFKGPQVMMGYYKDKKGTREVFTEDGFFRSGDIGAIDEDGYLSITGRIKDIIITSGGKNISPQVIENSLKDSRFIEQVSIIGDRRKFLSALIIPAFDELRPWAQECGVAFRDNEELIQNDEVINLYEKEFERCTRHLSRVERIKKFRLLSTEWSQQTGELTPTLKIKRNVVEEKYRELIEEMYPPDFREA